MDDNNSLIYGLEFQVSNSKILPNSIYNTSSISRLALSLPGKRKATTFGSSWPPSP